MNKEKQKALEFEAWKKEWVESALKNLHNDQKRKELVHEMILKITEENNEGEKTGGTYNRSTSCITYGERGF